MGRKAPPGSVFEIQGRGTLATLLPVLLVVSLLSLNKWSLFQSSDLFCVPFSPFCPLKHSHICAHASWFPSLLASPFEKLPFAFAYSLPLG